MVAYVWVWCVEAAGVNSNSLLKLRIDQGGLNYLELKAFCFG